MNPSPDRGKECLPPKKRESRQGSTEQRLPQDEFKPPAPLRSRPASTGRGEGARECHDGSLTNTNPHLLPSPPPLPAPVAPLPLPWHLAYPASVPLPLLSVGERRATGSPSWRDEPLPSPLPHHSRWFTREVPLHLPPPSSSSVSSSCSSSSPTFKSPFPADSREMWPYFNAGRRDYGSSHLFPPPPPPPHLFSHAPLYPADAGHRYLGKRPNGLDGPGSRTAPASRATPAGEYGNDGGGGSGGGGGGGGGRARPDLSPRGSHANGRRRLPEGGPLYLDSPAPEGPDTHSSLQDRDPRVATRIPSSSSSSTSSSSSSLLSTSPQPHGPDPRAGKGALLDPLGGSPAEAQIYYSLGSVYSTLQQSQHHHHHHSPQGPGQAYPLYSPSGSPLYGLAREHRAPGTRNSQHSPVGLRNSHDRTQREPERERERERSKEREREKEREQDREAERTSERERQRDRDRDRDRDRELSPGPYPAPPARASPPAPLAPRPPALLPHFAKGSLIELAGGRLKRVEELRTEDFLRSASTSPEFHLSACTVMLIAPGSAHGFSHLQVLLTDRNTQELLTVLVEYPFFVRDRGWSSCCPHRTTQLYGLPCRQLSEGDVCLALTPTPAPAAGPRPHAPRPAARAHRTQLRARVAPEPSGARHHHHREEMPPPPPPPPLPQHHHHHHHHPPPAALGPSPPAPALDPPAQEQPRPRKRRWSAPDTLTGTEKTPSDLPQGSKQRKWQ